MKSSTSSPVQKILNTRFGEIEYAPEQVIKPGPYISQVVVHGDKRNYCTALVTIEEESITKWATDNGIGGDYKDLTGVDNIYP